METVLAHAISACTTAGTTTHATGAGSGPVASGFDVVGLLVSVGLVIVFGAGVALAVFIANRISDRPRAGMPIPVQATVSPDGYYWWDGAAWRQRV